jgi:hypothetical protein
VLECESQTLGETEGIAGTPFTLNYRGDRVPGRAGAYSLRIPLSGPMLPANPMIGIDLEFGVAGRHFYQTFPASPNMESQFTWDGNDAYGRRVIGRVPVQVRVGFFYRAVLLTATNLGDSFAFLGRPEVLVPARQGIILYTTWHSSIGAWDARAQGLGGWTLDVHHAYDPAGGVLFLGNGRRCSAESLPRYVLSRVGGMPIHFASDANGLARFQRYLDRHSPHAGDFLILLEPTGSYGLTVLLYLLGKGYRVLQVDNRALKDYREKIFGSETQTDETDARLMARMGFLHDWSARSSRFNRLC